MPKPKANKTDEYIGNRLKELRTLRGVSSVDAAELIGASPQQYSRYELGRNRMSAVQLFHLAQCFGVPVSWFYLGLEDLVKPDKLVPGKDSYTPTTDKEDLEILGRLWPNLSTDQRAALMRVVDSILQK